MLPEQDIFLETLHRTYFNKLTPYAESALRDTARAQDVVQDAFHDALLHIDRLMAHKNPGGWLMKTVKKKIRDSERADRRYMYRFLSLDSDRSAELVPPQELAAKRFEQDGASPIEKIEKTLTAE